METNGKRGKAVYVECTLAKFGFGKQAAHLLQPLAYRRLRIVGASDIPGNLQTTSEVSTVTGNFIE